MQTTLRTLSLSFVIILILMASPVLSKDQDTNLPASLPSLERQKELTYLVQQDCGACHGMTLKGGLGPNLLPERVSILPTQYLIDVITNGRQETPMPPWGPLLTQQEIKWIAEQLQLGHLAQKRH